MSKNAILSLAAAASLVLAAYAALSWRPVAPPRPLEVTPPVALPPGDAPTIPSPAPSPLARSEQPDAAAPVGQATRPGPPVLTRTPVNEPRVDVAEPVVAAEAPRPQSLASSPVHKCVAVGASMGAVSAVGAGHPVRESKDEDWTAGLPDGFNTEAYAHLDENPFRGAVSNPRSTFSIDVDSASYANVRRFLSAGQLPPKDAVRIEELLNYFRYDYPEPESDAPFSISTEVGRCPWKPEHRLALVGLRGRSLDEENLPPRNLTFLLDVSGSMNSPDKLPLLKRAMGVLVDTLREEDHVAIVVYAGASGLVLPPTSGADKGEIRAALHSLRAGGSTAGGAGIELAYRVATDNFVEGGINRVILATDGDFNVGVSSEGDLVRLIEEKRETGVFLSVLGFGQGNLQDSRMEKLADHGNGNYSYIDSFREAHKVLGTEAGGTLVTIAKDVKIQVEFNPARVKAYRLIGYENRALRAEDFADDRKDAGEIGAGHTVTALYEIVPVGVPIDLSAVDPLRYQAAASSTTAHDDELLTVKLRHKEPDGERSRLQVVTVHDSAGGSPPSADLRFASAVAAFGMLLRDSEHRGEASWALVQDLARGALGDDARGYRSQFLELVGRAEDISEPRHLAIAR